MLQYLVLSIKKVNALYLSGQTARVALGKLLKENMVLKIRNKLYTCVSEENGGPVVNRFQIASAITPSSYVSHHTAFEFYGIVDQVFYEVLQNYTATTMLAHSEFLALLKQANTDNSKMAEVIGVSDAQLRFVTNSQPGMGFLKCGNVVIPFDNQIRKDTSLYKRYNTNLHEIISEMKEKEKQENS